MSCAPAPVIDGSGFDVTALAEAFSTDLRAHTVWQVKPSTLCNLRCRYCYEWDRLADGSRITLDQWRRIFQAAADYRSIRLLRHGIPSRIAFMWHGGEPLLLPPAYVCDALGAQREVFATCESADGGVINVVQTNLRRMNATLDTMIEAGFVVSASLDFATGVRVDASGRESDATVRANLVELTARGVRCGVTVVLGRHNHDRLPEIYDWLESIGASWLRVVPMFEPPATAPGGFALDDEAAIAALAGLFAHWVRSSPRMQVHPLQNVLNAVISRGAEFHATPHDRRRYGESRLVVHPDGALTAQGGTAQPDRVIGNVFAQNARVIFGSKAYQSSLDQDDILRARHCGQCRYRESCDGRPIFSHPHSFVAGPCPVDSRLMAESELHLEILGQT